MKVLLIDNGTTLLKKLEAIISVDEAVEKFDVFKKQDVNNFDLVILSGGSAYPLEGNENKFIEEIKFIKNTKKPLVGICFGCELIVEAFGGKLKKLETKDKGIKEIKIIDNELSKKSLIRVYESHKWGIDQLPDSFDVLAQSEKGPEIIKHKTLPIYGLQFHPENFVNETDGDEIFIKLLSKLQDYI